MPNSADICLRTTRSSIVRSVCVSSARRPSSAIPRLTEMKVCPDDDARHSEIDGPRVTSSPQTMDVYLRLKPRLTRSKRVTKVQDDTYVVLSPSTLLTKFPSLEGTTNPSNRSKSPESTSRKFNFTRIFGPESSQSEFFEQAIKRRVVDFLAGQNCTLMSYGTTNTGKSYTFLGTSQAPGIIPRTIEFVFSGVNCTLSPWYKPTNVNEVVSLNETGRCQEVDARESLLASKYIDKSVCEEAYGLLTNSMKEDTETGRSGGAMYSVWLSFVEIYNENIYDLLAEDESQVNKITSLKLVKDKQGRAFVQGLRMISATTGLEAYRIFITGQSRLTVGPSNLNPRSSRSHGIFTIKLLKYIAERTPHKVEVSTMTFCDLAGTGRSRKSAGSGNELKEAKNINTSLLVLGRCLKGVVDSQTSRQNFEVIGPFRESKLTRLFERVLTGKEDLTMIVNVDTSPDLYVETLSVLNFSAIAKRILCDTGKDVKRSHNSDETTAGTKDTEIIEWEQSTSCNPEEPLITVAITNKSELQKLQECNVSLTKEIEILRESALNREYEIRKEMSNFYGGMIKDLEANWKKRTEDVTEEQDDFLKWSVKQIENFYKERIDSLTNRKRRRTSGGDHEDDSKTLFDELESENAALTTKILVLRETVKKLKAEQEILSADKNKCVFELGLAKDELRQVRNVLNDERGEEVLRNDGTKVVDDLRALIAEKNEKIKNLQRKTCTPSTQTKNPWKLESMTTEDLEEELRKRTGRIIDEKPFRKLKILEESTEVESDQNVDAKFSTLTFNKETTGLSQNYLRINEAEESENSMEKTNVDSSALSSTCPSLNPPPEESTNNLHNSFFETIDKVFQSSDDAANDSGIVVNNGISSSTEYETEEKGSQTNFDYFDPVTDRNADVRQERVEQLKLDYTKLTTELFHETLRVTEFSQKLEYIQYALSELKQITSKNEEKIIQYQDQLACREKDLLNLGQIKSDMETKLGEISSKLESTSVAYEKRIDELRAELKHREDSENRNKQSLQECQEKSLSLESQLSVAHAQLDETSIKCFTEHIPKIEKLEKELVEKSRRMEELDGRVLKRERDMERLTELNEKVTDFASVFDKYQSERDELRRQLLERLETQSALEYKLKRLTSKVHERENEISLLRTDLGNIVKMNMENSERARELSKEISVALGRLDSAKCEMVRSEDERRKLERTSGHEIGNLIARLADFEKNAPVLTRMRDNEHLKMDELDRLKILLHEKEREMCLFKKNRDKTIRRYETLIRKLQADVEMLCKRESSKLRMLYPKKTMSKESLKSSESFCWKSTLVESVERKKASRGTALGRKRSQYESAGRKPDYRWPHSFPSCSRCSTTVKRSSSHALVTSSTSLEGSRSSRSKIFPIGDDDEDEDDCVEQEIIETESCADVNLDMVESMDHRRKECFSEAAATFSIASTSDESHTDFRNIPGWIDIRRTNGRTHFRMRKGDPDVRGHNPNVNYD